MQALVEACLDVNAISESDGTPLCLAALKGRKDIVQMLLADRANVHAEIRQTGTALHAVYSAGDVEIMRMLLDNGAKVDAVQRVRSSSLPTSHLIRPGGVQMRDAGLEWELQPIHVLAMKA